MPGSAGCSRFYFGAARTRPARSVESSAGRVTDEADTSGDRLTDAYRFGRREAGGRAMGWVVFES